MSRAFPITLSVIVVAICAAVGLHDMRSARPAPAPVTLPPVHLDSSQVIRAESVQHVRDSIAVAVRDSLRHAFRSAPIREVIRWLPASDTIHDTLPPVTVPDATIRATADSLATCQQGRDSLAGAVTIATARDSLHRSALDSANRRTCPAPVPQPTPPSRALWASIGGTAVALITAAIVIISR